MSLGSCRTCIFSANKTVHPELVSKLLKCRNNSTMHRLECWAYVSFTFRCLCVESARAFVMPVDFRIPIPLRNMNFLSLTWKECGLLYIGAYEQYESGVKRRKFLFHRHEWIKPTCVDRGSAYTLNATGYISLHTHAYSHTEIWIATVVCWYRCIEIIHDFTVAIPCQLYV